jgi:hypothetical protein
VSRAAQQNLRSLSITFDLRECQILPSDVQARITDRQFEGYLAGEWNQLAGMLRHLDLRLLEVCFKNCYCVFCRFRMTGLATMYLLSGIASSPRVVLKGFVDSDEVRMVRDSIDDASNSVVSDAQDDPWWYPEYDDEDPDDKLKLAFGIMIK